MTDPPFSLFHPLANLFPLIEGADFEALVADVRANGLREHIVVHEGLILDGRNRFRAAVAADLIAAEIPARGSAPFTQHFSRYLPDRDGDALAFVISKNLARRHLNESQRAFVAAKIANLTQGRPGSEKQANLPVKQRDAAQLLNISERSVRSAAVVRDKGTPELQHAVETGKIAVSEAAKAAKLGAEKQTEIAAAAEAGKANVVRTAIKRETRDDREVALAAKQRDLPQQKFGVILADPEWRFEPWSRATGMDRAADNHYPTSCTEVIASRDVAAIAADDCVLFLWATAPMLPQAFVVMGAWGFDYRSNFVWAKDRVGTGYWNRNRHEHLLIGIKGRPPAPAPGTQWDSLIHASVGAHSAKPDGFHELIEAYFPNLPKAELNCRGKARPGWVAWGNEAEQAA
ncbi:hypothetical protein CWB41_13885 [Methylovirgula ligni]|uniref:N6-adenosine-specific RNA methylase IME4 n=1 Tax=Methylovirgula ligni TaxID=569860 RepID=A0A3D9YL47_9HYPH|nr:MT-A70 family methyltransferase [Methylovirgula ligni]QAY96684.1 hypothetical protein CWB41_13885 [Methylovirgula ligni]REF83275.1 N6-adenosine-specific RNA methylase IME4 [Methylovirgula ligni]